MDYRAIARERGRLDDFIIPFHRNRLVLLVDQDFQKGKQVPGIKAGGGGGDAAGNIEVTDNLHVVYGHELAGFCELAIAATLCRKPPSYPALQLTVRLVLEVSSVKQLCTGSGGPGYKFNDEPVRSEYTPGAVAMANSGANTNGSQFFICTVDDSKKLAKSYNLFGYVQTGMDVVLKIAQGDTMTSVTVQEETG